MTKCGGTEVGPCPGTDRPPVYGSPRCASCCSAAELAQPGDPKMRRKIEAALAEAYRRGK